MSDTLLRKIKYTTLGVILILLVVTQWEARLWALFADMLMILFVIYYTLYTYLEFRWWKLIVMAGGILNTITVIVNGGRMPVLSRTEVGRWWQPLTPQSRLKFLCDIYAGCSIGDMLIGVGMLAGITIYAYKALRPAQLIVERN